MPCRSTSRTVVVALFACGMAIGPPKVIAADPLTPFDPTPSVIRTAVTEDGSRWLTPDAAFTDVAPSLSVSLLSLPLLSLPLLKIPAIQEPRSPVIQASYADDSRSVVNTGVASPRPEKRIVSPTAEQVPSTKQKTVQKETDLSQRLPSFADLQMLGESSPTALDNLPRLLFKTLIVLATCAGTLLLARRWLMRSGMVVESHRNRRLQIVATLTVAPRSQLHVVKFDDREVLVGVDSRGLQQIQIVTPSFEAELQTSQEQDIRTKEADESNDGRRAKSARRLFTAV